MIICDKCNLEIRPDNSGFSGQYLESPHKTIHLCDDCSGEFRGIYSDFIWDKIVRVGEKEGEKKKK